MSDEWIDLALCKAFANLPWLDDQRTPAATCAMTAVCLACPVLEECQQFVAEHDVVAGFWAGHDRTADFAHRW